MIRRTRCLIAVAGLLVVFGLVVFGAACTDTDGTLRFENDTDTAVFVGFTLHGDGPFDPWTEVPPRERVVYSDGGCLREGELVVATAPDAAAIIDRREITNADDGICSTWTWSGVGDHE